VSLNYRDLAMLERSLGKWTGAQLPGSEMAGEVEAVGAGVTRFAVGDKVISVDVRHWIDGPAPEVGTNTARFPGRLAEYVTVPEDLLVRAPVWRGEHHPRSAAWHACPQEWHDHQHLVSERDGLHGCPRLLTVHRNMRLKA
jgi:NADPH:quinone reductase-like Zn-dependent oxidoreductase